MTLAPEPILHAALATIHFATVCARNWTCTDDVSRKQINELMDAIHEIPQMIQNWNNHELDDVLTHLSCFDHQKWRNAVDLERHSIPNIAEFFEERLTEFSDPSTPKG